MALERLQLGARAVDAGETVRRRTYQSSRSSGPCLQVRLNAYCSEDKS
jgi:hypothetical protein